ncbi:MAG: hypothetical protein AVDCRST_MAG68-4039 [uncultured Gemmatimonadetes bacterium]|uniref:DNA-binding protein n=1 Tax=uncultured Gemmatimonadota bacterium TaxID=203437 RepID=A0A6J4M233_9BACT|nr:MAG: hypothetical protein AVDCRST_MAG68-4039 [uncultured Gemmatimonadota bacterium]
MGAPKDPRALKERAARGKTFRSGPKRFGTDAPSSERSIRADFLRRMRALTRDLARNAPSKVLADALSRPSARGAITHVLGEVEPTAEELEVARLRERAMERGLAMRERLREDAGGFLDTAQVAARLGVRRQSVDKRRKEGGLLALETPQGHFLFPACQLTSDGTIPGLKEVLAVMKGGGFWETLAGLVTPAPALAGRSILQALQQCRGDEERRRIVELAGAYTTG